MRRTRAWCGSLVLALALVGGLAGCRDGDDGADPSPAEAGPSTDEGASGPVTDPADEEAVGTCRYATTEAVSEAFDRPTELTYGRERVCSFEIGGGMVVEGGVELSISPVAQGWTGEGVSIFPCDEGTKIDVVAGGGGYACLTNGGPYGAVLLGDGGLWVGAPPGTADPLAVRDRIAALLPHVTLG